MAVSLSETLPGLNRITQEAQRAIRQRTRPSSDRGLPIAESHPYPGRVEIANYTNWLALMTRATEEIIGTVQNRQGANLYFHDEAISWAGVITTGQAAMATSPELVRQIGEISSDFVNSQVQSLLGVINKETIDHNVKEADRRVVSDLVAPTSRLSRGNGLRKRERFLELRESRADDKRRSLTDEEKNNLAIDMYGGMVTDQFPMAWRDFYLPHDLRKILGRNSDLDANSKKGMLALMKAQSFLISIWTMNEFYRMLPQKMLEEISCMKCERISDPVGRGIATFLFKSNKEVFPKGRASQGTAPERELYGMSRALSYGAWQKLIIERAFKDDETGEVNLIVDVYKEYLEKGGVVSGSAKKAIRQVQAHIADVMITSAEDIVSFASNNNQTITASSVLFNRKKLGLPHFSLDADLVRQQALDSITSLSNLATNRKTEDILPVFSPTE